jgi:hypothetical protein
METPVSCLNQFSVFRETILFIIDVAVKKPKDHLLLTSWLTGFL